MKIAKDTQPKQKAYHIHIGSNSWNIDDNCYGTFAVKSNNKKKRKQRQQSHYH